MEGWTLDASHRGWVAHGGHGCYIHFPEAGSVPTLRYTRPMHPDDVTQHGFPHERARHEPIEELYVATRKDGTIRYGWLLTDGYQNVATVGRYFLSARSAS